jgi:hypothetical protein
MIECLADNELKEVKGSVLCWYLPGGAEESHEECQSRNLSVGCPKYGT